MKLIRMDNFDREHIADKLIAENIESIYVHLIADRLNSGLSADSPYFYKAVDDFYKLSRGEENG